MPAGTIDCPSEEAIRLALEQILKSSTFKSAEAQKRFIAHVVALALAGRQNEIKEYSIGVEVFERGDSFDPRLDNIVRAEARKIRLRLAKYYENEGRLDPVRISLSSRGYVPQFEFNGAEQSVSPSEPPTEAPSLQEPVVPAAAAATLTSRFSARATWINIAVAAGVLVVAAAAYLLFRPKQAALEADENPSIAVIPFQSAEGDSSDAFRDGLADELIDSLGRVPGLHVVARTSTFQFKGKTDDVREIGQKLKVHTVLVGSIQRSGNRIRVSAQLEDAQAGYRIWSSTYDRDFDDALSIERDIASSILKELRRDAKGNRELLALIGKDQTGNGAAYREYLQGVYFWNKNDAESIRTAMAHFQSAIQIDPRYALAHAGLARCYIGLPSFTPIPSEEVIPQIRKAAGRALELDPNLGEAHIYLGYAALLGFDWANAETAFHKGLELDPGNAVGHRWYANYLLLVGRLEEALREDLLAEELDPVSPYIIQGTVRTLEFLGRYEQAEQHARKALELDPGFGLAHQALGLVMLRMHKYDIAIQEIEIARQKLNSDPTRLGHLAYIYAVTGDQQRARKIINQLESDSGRQHRAPARALAEAYIGLGENDQALHWLTQAVEQQDRSLFLKVDPLYAGLRSDPRFLRLLDRMNLR